MGAHSPELLQLDLWDEHLPTTVGVKPTTVLSYGLGADSTLICVAPLRRTGAFRRRVRIPSSFSAPR